jgi:hypothetical protein
MAQLRAILVAAALVAVVKVHACERNEHGVFEELKCASQAASAPGRAGWSW